LDYVLRFLAGGLIVSGFAIISDVLRPRSFAGLFGAAPSVALATLTIALFQQGSSFVSIEGRSMMIGAVALVVYCLVVCQLLKRFRLSATAATGTALLVWIAVATGSKQLLIG
jgi:uncharacterized membrane protein (GlpM family)